MAEVTESAYTWVRAELVEKSTRVVLKDDLGAEILNLPIETDERFTWIHPTKEVQTGWDQMGNKLYSTVPDSQTLQLQIIITGSDSGITLPTTFAKSELHDDQSNILSTESFTPFEMTQAEDKITITHNIEVPKL